MLKIKIITTARWQSPARGNRKEILISRDGLSDLKILLVNFLFFF